ncbi:MAG: serine/threonine protein kinase, partial [Planctomycetota bacterium]
FIAPEQAINSQSVDARADIYSLGCSWYFLLCGKPPFSGTTVAQRLAKHQTAPVPSVSSHRADCPPAIDHLIQRMMSKRPADRPASAAELLTQLNRIRGTHQSSSELANRPLGTGSTSVSEDPSSYSSIDDSGPLRDASPSSMPEVGEIDFGNLPSIDISSLPPATAPVTVSPLAAPRPSTTPSKSKKSSSLSSDAGQNVLLGVGLAMSIMALLVVLGITFYQVTKEEKQSVNVKQTESGSERVIVIRE